jgi:hypothetical protein
LYTDHEWNASPFHPSNNINGFRGLSRGEILSLTHPELVAIQEEFVRQAVRELNEFENLYFEVCNEPYERGVESAGGGVDLQLSLLRTAGRGHAEL